MDALQFGKGPDGGEDAFGGFTRHQAPVVRHTAAVRHHRMPGEGLGDDIGQADLGPAHSGVVRHRGGFDGLHQAHHLMHGTQTGLGRGGMGGFSDGLDHNFRPPAPAAV